MSMQRDSSRIVDMLTAAHAILRYMSGVSQDDFVQQDMLQDAVIRQVTIIGEAASQISAEFRAAHPDIPWLEVVGMRHRLVHGYGQVSLATVWKTIQVDVPQLITCLDEFTHDHFTRGEAPSN